MFCPLRLHPLIQRLTWKVSCLVYQYFVHSFKASSPQRLHPLIQPRLTPRHSFITSKVTCSRLCIQFGPLFIYSSLTSSHSFVTPWSSWNITWFVLSIETSSTLYTFSLAFRRSLVRLLHSLHFSFISVSPQVTLSSVTSEKSIRLSHSFKISASHSLPTFMLKKSPV